MSRKEPSFGQLLAYIALSEPTEVAISHNLKADVQDLEAVHREFLDNYRYLPRRKNGNVLYHEVLSFSDQDRAQVTPAILEDLTRKYLDLRAPFALAYARAHSQETDCAHMHIMISANNQDSTKRVSLSRAEFAQVKRQLERYQKDRYPFLEHSIVFDHSRRKLKPAPQRRPESERERRLMKEDKKETSRKEQLHELVAEQITLASSAKGFRQRLKFLGLQLYRGDDGYGVLDSAVDAPIGVRKYRLSTLGLDETFRQAQGQWQKLPQHLMAMPEHDLAGAERLWLKQTTQQQIQDVVGLHAAELSPLERERLEQIRSLRTDQKQQRECDPPAHSL